MILPRTLLRGLSVGLLLCGGSVGVSLADGLPMPPCGVTGSAIEPPYAAVGAPPSLGIWHEILLPDDACFGPLAGRNALVIALSSRFRFAGGIESMAQRIGAISATTGLVYWSVTDQDWRTLIVAAHAVVDPASRRPRADFGADEVLSGRTLYFVQDDTRSSGLNLFSLRAAATDSGRITAELVNLSDIRLLLLPLFKREALTSVHVIERLQKDIWGYYSLSAIRGGRTKGHTGSLANRAESYRRLITGLPVDRDPPLVRGN